ncbi:MAG: hypothetical protein ACXWBN_03475 [Acidimicrobiales bacterium]
MSDPTEPTVPPINLSPDSGLREGHTGGVGNFSVMRQDESAGAELAGGLSETAEPVGPTGPDPFDLDDAYPQGAELAGRLGPATPLDR